MTRFLVQLSTVAISACISCYSGVEQQNDPETNDSETGTDGESEGTSDVGGEDECEARTFSPIPTRLLSNVQYENLVRRVFPAVPTDSFAALPPDAVSGGFVVGASVVDEIRLSALMQVASSVAAYTSSEFEQLVPDCPDESDRDCAHAFVSVYGSALYRRPLTENERTDLRALYDATSQDGGGIKSVTQALLLAGPVLYQEEPPVTQPTPVPGLELAARMALLLWNDGPSDELLTAASAGGLDTEEGVRDWAGRMLDAPEAGPVVREFHRQWLSLEDLENDPDLSDAAHAEFSAFVESVTLDPNSVFADLFTSTRALLDAQTAELYGLPDPGPDWVDLPDSERAGLLTRAGFLLGNGPQTAPTPRGQRVRTKLLCQDTPPVPGDVDFPPFMEDLTPREFVEYHLGDPLCAACHEYLDPIGLAFEEYDQHGRFRSEYAQRPGEAIDPSGEVVPLPGRPTDVDGTFTDVRALGERMASSQSVRACYGTQWYRYVFGRPLSEDDMCEIQRIDRAFANKGAHPRDLLIELVASPAFRFRHPTK